MDETNFEKNKEKIVSEITRKVNNLKCPMCFSKSFTMTEGYFAHVLQNDLKNINIGGKSIPVVPIVCKNCGYILEFAAGVLGLLSKSEIKDTPKTIADIFNKKK